jgi:hypothetical protein
MGKKRLPYHYLGFLFSFFLYFHYDAKKLSLKNLPKYGIKCWLKTVKEIQLRKKKELAKTRYKGTCQKAVKGLAGKR